MTKSFILSDLIIIRISLSSELTVVSLSSVLYKIDDDNLLSLTMGVN